MADEETEFLDEEVVEGEEGEEAPPKSKKLLFIILAVVLLGGGGGAWFFLQGGKSDAKVAVPQLPPIYVNLDPPFVVNFEADSIVRFLQVTVTVMTRDAPTSDVLKKNDPRIRNDLLMLLGGQTYETISSREGKEKLRGEALSTVAGVVAAEGGKAESVEQLYFTSFVMQ